MTSYKPVPRECNKCRETKPPEAFPCNSAQCRQCRSGMDKGRVRSNPRDAKRNDTNSARDRKRKWAAANTDHVKQAARRAVRGAIESGALLAPTGCAVCGANPTRRDGARAVQAHHRNGYDRPLDIVWLCPPCHRAEHNDAARKP